MLAAKAYDYETNLDPLDAGSPVDAFQDILAIIRFVSLCKGGFQLFDMLDNTLGCTLRAVDADVGFIGPDAAGRAQVV